MLIAAEEEPLVRAAILAAGDAGLRSGEVRALMWSRIDFVNRQLTVAEAFWRNKLGTPKGGRIGNVPMTEELTAALKAQRRPGFEFVFANEHGKPSTRDLGRHGASATVSSGRTPRDLVAQAPPHVLLASRDAGRVAEGDHGARTAHVDRSHAAVHAPEPRAPVRGDRATRPKTDGRRRTG